MTIKGKILICVGALVLTVCGARLGAEETPKADFIGTAACLACHTAQDGFQHSVHGRKLTQLKGIESEKTCETCHGPGSIHQQAAGDKTHPGFSSLKQFKQSPKLAADTCLQCHQDTKRIHWAGGVHDSRRVSCLSCHSVHNPKSKHSQLTAIDEKTLCFQCHGDIKAEFRRNSHMPLLEGKLTCKDCHNAHGSGTGKMLAADSLNQLCFNCHAEKRGPNLWAHAPVQENCNTCHTAHGSHHDKMLNAKLPMLCQRCHMQSGHDNHAYDVTELRQNRMLNKGCTNCHSNIHGSNHPSGKYLIR